MAAAPIRLRDRDIRDRLKERLIHEHRHDPSTVVIDELGIRCGRARADVAVVNGVLRGVEIKSDADSLRRLSGQIDMYNDVVDRATLVVTERHLDHAMPLVPDWWDVLMVGVSCGALKFKRVQTGRLNRDVNPRAVAELLWRDEVLALLREKDMAQGLASKRRRFAWDRLCEVLTKNQVRDAVRSVLKARPIVRAARPLS